MADETAFPGLIRLARAGDQDAIRQIVTDYTPRLLHYTGQQLTQRRMTRLLDPADICQTVFSAFFDRLAKGMFQLESPDDLSKLLVTMCRNRVLDEARKQLASRRDARRLTAGTADHHLDTIVDPQGTPSKIAVSRELVGEFYRRLAPDERFLAEQRAKGREWADLAAELDVSAEALRKKLDRAVTRVLQQLGLAEKE